MLFHDNFLLVGTTRCGLLRVALDAEKKPEEQESSRSSRRESSKSNEIARLEDENIVVANDRKSRGPLKNATIERQAVTLVRNKTFH